MRRSRLVTLLAVGAALVVAVFASRSRPAVREVPELVRSDSVADPDAVGMCGMNRRTGQVEGRIEALVQREGRDRPHFRIRSLTNPSATYVMDPADVQVVECSDPQPTGRP